MEKKVSIWSTVLNSSPIHYKKCRISLLALIKMLHHGTKGGIIEVMGYLRGKVEGDTFYIMDSYPLPVEGTETRVNAGNEALEYTGAYEDLNEVTPVYSFLNSKIIKLKENVVGWYHTHPNYGPWLSGIDVSTQKLMQTGGDPFIAIVLDPIRTHISGKVDIGAFRTCPEESHPGWDDEDQIIPEEKVKDFGLQYKQYYKLDVSYYMCDKDNELIDVRGAICI